MSEPKFTEKDFMVGLNRLYYGSRWPWLGRLKWRLRALFSKPIEAQYHPLTWPKDESK